MSLFADYLYSRLGQQTIESEKGLIVYGYYETPIGKQVFVHDIYVPVEFRRTGEALRLVNEMKSRARLNGCTHAMAGIDITSNGATDAMKFQISVGLKLHRIEGNMIYMFMEL